VSNLNPFQRFLANSVEALKEGARKSERATRVENSYSPSAFNVAGKYSKRYVSKELILEIHQCKLSVLLVRV
jgi:hypothetical protein